MVKTNIWDTLAGKSKQAYRRQGLGYIAKTGIKMALDVPKNRLFLLYYKRFSSKTFDFQGKMYRYLIHPYCTSWKNERAVLIPIIWEIVKKYEVEGKRILEVGNTLSYVYSVSHDILDKYELVEGVINEDVVTFNPVKDYDLIFSIVTMQCIGWDEVPREPIKIVSALKNLSRILNSGGQLIVGLGLGYNPHLDELLKKGALGFDKQYYLKRISTCNWKEVGYEEIENVKYNESIPTSIGIVIGILNKK